MGVDIGNLAADDVASKQQPTVLVSPHRHGSTYTRFKRDGLEELAQARFKEKVQDRKGAGENSKAVVELECEKATTPAFPT
ncbi:MAG: hypothetical protein QXM80_02065 [Thermofilaceae archaeon]